MTHNSLELNGNLFILKFEIQFVVLSINLSFPIVYFRILIHATENLKFKNKGQYTCSHWQCSQYLDLNPTCALALPPSHPPENQICLLSPKHNTVTGSHHTNEERTTKLHTTT